MYAKCLLVLLSAGIVVGQRPSFAGTEPIGFPALTEAKPSDPFGNRFGEQLELPLEAKGDRDLVERISKLPVDKQPFWYINWKALEAQRKNPQTFQQKPNVFNNQDAASSGGVNQSGLTSKFGETAPSQSQNFNAQNPTANANNPNQNYNQNQNYSYRNSKRHY